MPMITITLKERIELQYSVISRLEEKCSSCELLREKVAKQTCTYEAYRNHTNDKDTVMIAIATYEDNIYAIYVPEHFNEKQMRVFEFLLRDIEPENTVIVFTEESYNAVKKYSCGKPINVKLYV